LIELCVWLLEEETLLVGCIVLLFCCFSEATL
jgi:hypothetical protein